MQFTDVLHFVRKVGKSRHVEETQERNTSSRVCSTRYVPVGINITDNAVHFLHGRINPYVILEIQPKLYK